jgi:hypothetical protein
MIQCDCCAVLLFISLLLCSASVYMFACPKEAGGTMIQCDCYAVLSFICLLLCSASIHIFVVMRCFCLYVCMSQLFEPSINKCANEEQRI